MKNPVRFRRYRNLSEVLNFRDRVHGSGDLGWRPKCLGLTGNLARQNPISTREIRGTREALIELKILGDWILGDSAPKQANHRNCFLPRLCILGSARPSRSVGSVSRPMECPKFVVPPRWAMASQGHS